MSWVCRDDCKREFETDAAFAKHLKDDHGVTATKGTREMTLHLDCAREAISTFKWTIEGQTYHQSLSTPRGRYR